MKEFYEIGDRVRFTNVYVDFDTYRNKDYWIKDINSKCRIYSGNIRVCDLKDGDINDPGAEHSAWIYGNEIEYQKDNSGRQIMDIAEEITGALARGFCHKETENLEMDATLVQAMLEELKPVTDRIYAAGAEAGKKAQMEEAETKRQKDIKSVIDDLLHFGKAYRCKCKGDGISCEFCTTQEAYAYKNYGIARPIQESPELAKSGELNKNLTKDGEPVTEEQE